MPEFLSPFVYWAQTEDKIFLKIDLRDVKEPIINLGVKTVQFFAYGYGAKGLHEYEFNLDMYSDINHKESDYKVFDRQVEIVLKKKANGWWPRATAKPQKPAWLKIDFDRWKSEEDVEEDESRNVMGDYPDIYDKLHTEEYGYRTEDIKKVYLIIYNLVQFVGFMYISTVLVIRYMKDPEECVRTAFETVGSALKFVQLLQFLEIMHPMFGYVKGGMLAPTLQVCGRNFVLFLLIDAEPRIQDKPVIFLLILSWTCIELVRYPYYISQLYHKEISLLSWLRYSLWVPLYPMGCVCEGIIGIRNIPYFEETQKFTVMLPNKWNIAFHFPTLLRIYVLFCLCPGLYFAMSHMYKARVKKLNPYKLRRA